MTDILLFTNKNCPNCEAEKKLLKENRIVFKEIDIESKEFDILQYDLLRWGIVVAGVPVIVRRTGDFYCRINKEDLI